MSRNSRHFPLLSKYSESEVQSLIDQNEEFFTYSYNALSRHVATCFCILVSVAVLSQNIAQKHKYLAYSLTFVALSGYIGYDIKLDRQKQRYQKIEDELQAIREERILVLRVLLRLARADGKFTDEEREIIQSLALEMEINDFDFDQELENSSQNIYDILAKIQSSEAKQFLTKQIIHLCYCDGAYDAFERKTLFTIADGLSETSNFVEEMEVQYAQEYLSTKLEKQSNETAKQKRTSKGFSWKKVGLIGGLSVAGGLVAFATGGAAAPAIGGFIGSQFMGLSGAAAVSAGTAALGLGSLASGGFGIAGGTLVVSTLFGGAGAASIAKSLSNLDSDLEEFQFVPTYSEKDERSACHSVICIHGFLQQGMHPAKGWREVSKFFQHSHTLSLSWESKKLSDLGEIFSDAAFKVGIQQGFGYLAKSGLKAAGGMIALPLGLIQAFSIIDNPWSVATRRAEEAGLLLGKCIAEMKSPVSLFGYSLGSRVIVYALEYLLKRKIYGKVFDVYLLAGAVSSKSKVFHDEHLDKVVSHKIHNVYSKGDVILQYVYRCASLGDEPIGIKKLNNRKIINLDCTDFVKGHRDYPYKLGKILEACRQA